MSTTLVLVVVLVFSFVTGQIARRLRGAVDVPAAGVYALVGLAVGPLGLQIVTADILDQLLPVLSLLLGLIGFGMGLRIRRQLSSAHGIEAGALVGVIVAAGVAGLSYGVLWLATQPDDPWTIIWISVAVGATAAVCDSQRVEGVAARIGARGPVADLAQTLAAISSIVAILVLGVSLALARARQTATALDLTPAEWLLAAGTAGIACGILFVLFIGRWGNDQRAFLATVAIVTFSSGIAAALGISPLLAGLLAGVTASLLSVQAEAVGEALERLEAPAFIGIVVLAGAMWHPPMVVTWLVLPAAIGGRMLLLQLSGFVAPRIVTGLPSARGLGNALLPQGALAAAIAANFSQVFPESGAVLLTVGLIGVLVSDVLGQGAVRRVLADSGEVEHAAVAAESS